MLHVKFEEWALGERKRTNPNARLTKASGALLEKGDLSDAEYHIECKHSVRDSITVLWSWWTKASKYNKPPLLVVGCGSYWSLGYSAAVIAEGGSGGEEYTTKNLTLKDFRPREFRWHGIDFMLLDDFPSTVWEDTNTTLLVVDALPGNLVGLQRKTGLSKVVLQSVLNSLITQCRVTNKDGTYAAVDQ